MKKRSVFAMAVATVLMAASSTWAVDGVIEINEAAAQAGGVTPGDAPGYPVTISLNVITSKAGSVRLTGPLSLTNFVSADAIVVDSPNVSVDLNGFTINCFTGTCTGSGVASTQDNVTVLNG